MEQSQTNQPSLWKWVLNIAASAGLAGMLCCVAPAVLFMFGLMGGVYAISFASFFYQEDGSAGLGAWLLRILAFAIALAGIVLYRRKQNQCSIDPKRKRKNLVLAVVMIPLLGVGFFFTLEKLSSWYFDTYIMATFESSVAGRQTSIFTEETTSPFDASEVNPNGVSDLEQGRGSATPITTNHADARRAAGVRGP